MNLGGEAGGAGTGGHGDTHGISHGKVPAWGDPELLLPVVPQILVKDQTQTLLFGIQTPKLIKAFGPIYLESVLLLSQLLLSVG